MNDMGDRSISLRVLRLRRMLVDFKSFNKTMVGAYMGNFVSFNLNIRWGIALVLQSYHFAEGQARGRVEYNSDFREKRKGTEG